ACIRDLNSFPTRRSSDLARRTAREHLRVVEQFIDWTHRHGMPVCKLNEQSLTGFDHHLSRCRRPHYNPTKRLQVVHGARLFLTRSEEHTSELQSLAYLVC